MREIGKVKSRVLAMVSPPDEGRVEARARAISPSTGPTSSAAAHVER